MEREFSSIPEELFLTVYMVRDIRKARLLPSKERKPGESDIIIESPLGITDRVSRNELVAKYRYANGKKIKLGGWKRDQGNLVMSQEQEAMYAIFIPVEYEMEVATASGAKIINYGGRGNGTYVICKDNGYGGISTEDVYTVSPKYFRKMFCMSGSIKEKALGCEELQRRKRAKAGEKVQGNFGIGITELNMGSIIDKLKQKVGNKAAEDKASEMEIEEDYDTLEDIVEESYKVTHRLVQNGKNIGFVMEDNVGSSASYTKSEILDLCKRGLILNARIKQSDGKESLYGVGIKLSELPEAEM